MGIVNGRIRCTEGVRTGKVPQGRMCNTSKTAMPKTADTSALDVGTESSHKSRREQWRHRQTARVKETDAGRYEVGVSVCVLGDPTG